MIRSRCPHAKDEVPTIDEERDAGIEDAAAVRRRDQSRTNGASADWARRGQRVGLDSKGRIEEVEAETLQFGNSPRLHAIAAGAGPPERDGKVHCTLR